MISLNNLMVLIQCQIFNINPLICIYINRINNRLVFKLKDEYELELQTPEIMKSFGSTK